MVQLMGLMGYISVVVLPLMITLSTFDGLSSLPKYYFSQFSLGNIGGASSVCVQENLMTHAAAFRLECTQGLVIDLDAKGKNSDELIFDSGIIPMGAPYTTYCRYSDDM